jgi:uncharacterized RDD family membrane protein YckC
LGAVTRALYADEGWRPAGAFWRFLATLLDMALYCGLCTLIAVPVGQAFDWSALWGSIDEIANAAADQTWLGHASSILGLWIALWWCYFIVGWGLLGATPGKWAVGLRITDYRQRCPIGPARAALRLAAYCVSSMTFEWGHLVILVRTDRRALHDVLAGTRVVRKHRPARTADDQDSAVEAEHGDGNRGSEQHPAGPAASVDGGEP